MNHKGKDAHHGGTALVELDGALLKLGLLVELVPSEVLDSVAEVADELTGLGAIGGILHDKDLQETDEEEELDKSASGNVLEGIKATGNGGEAVARIVDVARETDSGGGDEVSDVGKHGNTAVLDLDVTEAVEVLLVTVSDEAKGIVKAKRLLDTELVLEGIKGSGRLASLSGGKGGGGAGEGSDDGGGLHGC